MQDYKTQTTSATMITHSRLRGQITTTRYIGYCLDRIRRWFFV